MLTCTWPKCYQSGLYICSVSTSGMAVGLYSAYTPFCNTLQLTGRLFFFEVPGLIRVARKLDVDCAPAVIGFEFNAGGCHPKFDGFVVCEEFKEIMLDAWNQVTIAYGALRKDRIEWEN